MNRRFRDLSVLGESMLNTHLQKKLDAVRPPTSMATCILVLRTFAAKLLGVVVIASTITAFTTCLTVWVSTLPAFNPASMSLAFRSWSRIIEFNAYIWLSLFVLGALIALIVSVRPQAADSSVGRNER